MRKISLILTILLIVVNIYSQNAQNEYEEWKSSQDEYANFDISKYFTPDIVRNQLDINFNLNSNYSRSNSNSETSNSSSTFAGGLLADFLRYTNTRKKISSFETNLSLSGNYVSQKYNSSAYSGYFNNNNYNSGSANGFGLDWANQWYFSKPFYMIYNISVRASYNFKQQKTETSISEISNQKQSEYAFNFSPQLGIGYGRIENVEDARQAVYIANALSKKKVLTRNLSNEELFELSQQISTVKNKRFLDSRLHLIDEISVVDSFFVKRDLLSNNGAVYFTTLYDMWQYGDLFSRQSGYEVSFVAMPRYAYDNLKYSPELQDEPIHYPQHNSFVETYLTFHYEKPVKLNWQHSAEITGYAMFPEKLADSNVSFSNNKLFSAWAGYALGYYPNTRTNIQGSITQRIGKIMYENNNNTYTADADNEYLTVLGISVNYYISPYFRISGTYNLNYQNDRYTGTVGNSKSNYFYSTLNINLIYSIF